MTKLHIYGSVEDQLEWFLKMNKMGFKAYITNNPIFFRDVVLKEIRNYF